jgi:hypothetical protein
MFLKKGFFTPNNLIIFFLIILSIILLTIKYSGIIGELTYINNNEKKDLLQKSIALVKTDNSISADKINKFIGQTGVIRLETITKDNRKKWYYLKITDNKPVLEEISDQEYLVLLSKAVGDGVYRENQGRYKAIFSDIIGWLDITDLTMLHEKMVLAYRGEGWFNLADNDMPILYLLDGRVYLGFLDGNDLYKYSLYFGNEVEHMRRDIEWLNKFTSGKGIIIFITIIVVGRKIIWFSLRKIKYNSKAS